MPRRRSPSLRWPVPGAVAAVVAAVVAVPQLTGSSQAAATLAPMSPGQLLVAVRTAADGARPLSGTVRESTSLGLPDLGLTGAGTGPQSLLTGTHTLRVWVGGATRQRVALLGPSAEYDVVRVGADLWTYESDSLQVAHATVAGASAGSAHPVDPLAVQSPMQLAQRLLAAVDPTTAVTVDDQVTVAGRAARELVLTPRTADTLVGSVRIAVDGATALPLRVQVYARSGGAPALSVGFTHLSLRTPSAGVFSFRPPRGATVTQLRAPEGTGRATSSPSAPASAPTTIGSGWASVLSIRPSGDSSSSLTDRLRQLSGPDPAGRVVQTRLVTVLLTTDGRILLGAVPANVLDRVAAGGR